MSCSDTIYAHCYLMIHLLYVPNGVIIIICVNIVEPIDGLPNLHNVLMSMTML